MRGERGMDARTSENLLLIVARAPVAGATKTRLGATIGMERAAELYRAFLADIAATFTPAAGDRAPYDFGWAVTPPEYDFDPVLIPAAVADRPVAMRVAQEGGDFGARLTNLFRWAAARGWLRTVILASDSPHLGRGAAEAAFAALERHDVAVARVHDGGYYLIGLRGFHDVLAGTPIGTADAADGVIARAAELGLSVGESAPTFDVDVEDDLATLRSELAPDGAAASATWAALARLGLAAVVKEPAGSSAR